MWLLDINTVGHVKHRNKINNEGLIKTLSHNILFIFKRYTMISDHIHLA